MELLGFAESMQKGVFFKSLFITHSCLNPRQLTVKTIFLRLKKYEEKVICYCFLCCKNFMKSAIISNYAIKSMLCSRSMCFYLVTGLSTLSAENKNTYSFFHF